MKYCDELYKNSWFLIKKKCDKYHIINVTINANQHIIRDANLPPNVEEFAEKSAGIIIISLINFYFKYNQCELHSKSRDIIAF